MIFKFKGPLNVAISNALSSVFRRGNSYPAVSSARGARNVRKLLPEAELYEKERVRLIQELGEQDKNGNWSVSEKSDGFAEFKAQIEPLSEVEHELDLDTIPMADIEAGYSRDENGKKLPPTFDAADIGLLEEYGIITLP